MTKLQMYQKIHSLPKHSRNIFWTLFSMVEETRPDRHFISFHELGERLYHMRAETSDGKKPITWSSIKGSFSFLREQGIVINACESMMEKGDIVSWKDTKMKQTYATIFNTHLDFSREEHKPWISFAEYHSMYSHAYLDFSLEKVCCA